MKDSFVTNELQWFSDVLLTRMRLYFNQESKVSDIYQIKPPELDVSASAYCRFLCEKDMGFDDRVMMMMAWTPYLKPQLLDCFMVKNSDTGRRFTEFGCLEGNGDDAVKPTLATVLFVLTSNDVERRVELADYFTNHPFFMSSQFFREDDSKQNSFSRWVISPSFEQLDHLLLQRPFVPRFSTSFPATLISTDRSWDELILEEQTMKQINDIKMWVKYGEKIRQEWGLAGKLKPGYRALFYGASGSGKTFTATLLGKEVGRQVFSIDLSMVVSKYIGETEKNLSKVFELAENKDWILFFDEADALFGKRTNVKDAHDRYANQEVAFLLQRVENYPGLVILSTNLKTNIDEAFARRFQIMVRFNMPNAKERELLWRNTFSSSCKMEEELDLRRVAEDYELAGGSILNVVQYCSLKAMNRGENIIRRSDLMEGIKKEYAKVGKMLKG